MLLSLCLGEPFREGVGHLVPGFGAADHFFVGEQAAVEFGGHSVFREILSDVDDLLVAVAEGLLRILHDRIEGFFVVRPAGLGRGGPRASPSVRSRMSPRRRGSCAVMDQVGGAGGRCLPPDNMLSRRSSDRRWPRRRFLG